MLNDLITDANSKMFLPGTVREYTFDGILDEILAAADTFPPNIHIPIPFDRFGWFYPVRFLKLRFTSTLWHLRHAM